jgi:hypothetical protein
VAVQLRFDSNGTVYFSLTCDSCHKVFTCYDNACYNFESLRTEATFAGWDTPPRPEHRKSCPGCFIRPGRIESGATTGG